MRARRAAMWALIDVLGTSLGVMLWSVHPAAKTEGIKKDALYTITADWPIDRDADVDLWLIKPDGHAVSFQNRDVGCAQLDMDNRGFLDGQVKLADGSLVARMSNKETVTLRCVEPGTYAVGVNLYNYHLSGQVQDPEKPVPVRVEITAMNPSVTTIFARDLALNTRGETVNATGFNLMHAGNDGVLMLTPAPLEPVTAPFFVHGAANQAIP